MVAPTPAIVISLLVWGVFLPDFPQLLNLMVDHFEKFGIFADYTRRVPAQFLCPPGHRTNPMPDHARNFDVPLGVDRM